MVSLTNNINEILALHFAGEKLTDEQEQILIDWVCQNKEEYRQLSEVFQAGMGSNRMNFNVEQAWKKVDSKLEKPKTFQLHTWGRYLSYAACVAVVMGISLFFLAKNENASSLYTNTTSSLLTVLLPDSSSVTLYPQAKVEYVADTKGVERRTELDGKAFFKVRPNAERPFIVNSNKTSVRVLGTSFLVDGTNHAETGIYVREGRVQVSTELERIVLEADEQAISNGRDLVKSTIDDSASVFEQHIGQKEYRQSPLSQVVRDLEEEFNVQIMLSDTIKKARISTQLRFANLEDILSEICYICNLNYRKISEKQFEFYIP